MSPDDPGTASAALDADGQGQTLRFHHIGVACRDLDAETRRLSPLGYRVEGTDFFDPLQGIHGRFLVGNGPRLELIVQAANGGVLQPWLNSGVKLYHMAYETPDLELGIAYLRGQRAKLVVKPVPAIAFQNRKIAFLMMPNMLLVELIDWEAPSAIANVSS